MSNDPYIDYLETLTNGVTISQAILEILHKTDYRAEAHCERRNATKSRKCFTGYNDDQLLAGQYIGPCDRE
jgi:hypothetical protein